MLTKTMIGAVAAGTILATSAFAQGTTETAGPSPVVAVENEPAPRLIVDQPLPEALARGVAVIPYRLENFRILPIVGAPALGVSPRVGHLHVTLDGLPWHWADFGNTNTIVVADLSPGRHSVRIELADPTHRVLTGKTVTFTVATALAQADSHSN
ncbi:MAG TPA: DUF6130 family protein [Acetobacteraceae bacterium]|jgi:hypothetical protein|nr:DUF6130 family protein [Acetobacteraceae bacterium]